MIKETAITCKEVPEEDRIEYTILAGKKLTCVLPSPEAYSKLSAKIVCLEDKVALLIMQIERLENIAGLNTEE
jgi:hypothetical protein